MKKIHILVEGQTEETFVNEVLAPPLTEREVFLLPKLAVTKRVKSGGQFKGGIVSYGKLAGEIRRLLEDRSADLVTTMIDFYGLPTDFPGRSSAPRRDCYLRVEHFEEAFRKDIGSRRFTPFLMLHEFEALVFVDPAKCVDILGKATTEALLKIRSGFKSPEEIDEGKLTAPSKRIQKLFPRYQKPLHGPLSTMRLRLKEIRSHCPHFHQWLSAIE